MYSSRFITLKLESDDKVSVDIREQIGNNFPYQAQFYCSLDSVGDIIKLNIKKV